MKAIVLEIKNGEAAVLCEDGSIVRTKQLAPVGETIELTAAVTRLPARRTRVLRSAVAAMLTLALIGGTYSYTNVAAASYVTLDAGESSVELSVNRMGRVIGVRALGDGSAELAQSLLADVRHMRVEDAVDAAVGRFGGEGTVVAGVTGETERRTADLHEAVERGMERGGHEGMEYITLDVSREERREAGEHDMSAGRWAYERDGQPNGDEQPPQPAGNGQEPDGGGQPSQPPEGGQQPGGNEQPPQPAGNGQQPGGGEQPPQPTGNGQPPQGGPGR